MTAPFSSDRRTLMRAAALAGAGTGASLLAPGLLGRVPVLAQARTQTRETRSPDPSDPVPVPVKCTEYFRSPEGVSPEGQLDLWRETRRPLLARLGGVTGVALNLVHRERSPQFPFDGMVETTFASLAAFRASMNGTTDAETLVELAANTPRFMQPAGLSLITTAAILREPPSPVRPTMAKRMGLVGRSPSTDRASFLQAWKDVHGPEVMRQPGLEGYVLNIAIEDRTPSSPWDGYAELWWSDWDAFDETSRQGSAGYAARAGFFFNHLVAYVTEYS